MTANKFKENVDLVLFSQTGVERIAMACAAAFAVMAGCSAARIEDLKTAVAEATSNAVVHGNRLRHDALVKVSLRLRKHAVEAVITDEGGGIEREVPEPDIERIIAGEAQPDGIGMFLIRRLADIVVFEPLSANGHSVRIIVNCSSRGDWRTENDAPGQNRDQGGDRRQGGCN